MRVYIKHNESLVSDILKNNNFTLLTPSEPNVSKQIWERNSERYKFIGWESEFNGLTYQRVKHPTFITMLEV